MQSNAVAIATVPTQAKYSLISIAPVVDLADVRAHPDVGIKIRGALSPGFDAESIERAYE